MSRDLRGNGIQEVVGSIPISSTKSFNGLRLSRSPASACANLIAFASDSSSADDHPAGAGANQCRVETHSRHTDNMTGTSTSTPTTVASAAPDPGP
jgi:hypothetical protein